MCGGVLMCGGVCAYVWRCVCLCVEVCAYVWRCVLMFGDVCAYVWGVCLCVEVCVLTCMCGDVYVWYVVKPTCRSYATCAYILGGGGGGCL